MGHSPAILFLSPLVRWSGMLKRTYRCKVSGRQDNDGKSIAQQAKRSDPFVGCVHSSPHAVSVCTQLLLESLAPWGSKLMDGNNWLILHHSIQGIYLSRHRCKEASSIHFQLNCRIQLGTRYRNSGLALQFNTKSIKVLRTGVSALSYLTRWLSALNSAQHTRGTKCKRKQKSKKVCKRVH